MDIYYLKKFRKRFTWNFADSICTNIRLLDMRKKTVYYCKDIEQVINRMIWIHLGYESMVAINKRREKRRNLANFNQELKLNNQKTKIII